MTKLSLDFASGQRNLISYRRSLPALAIFMAGTASAFLALREYDVQSDKHAELMHRQQVLRRLSENLNRSVPPEMAGRIEQANSAYAAIGIPWSAVLAKIESSRPDDIALLSLRMDSAAKTIRIAGEAKNFSTLSAFTSALSSQFAHVSLVNDKLSEGGTPIVVVFELDIDWQ